MHAVNNKVNDNDRLNLHEKGQLVETLCEFLPAFAKHEYDIGCYTGPVPRVMQTNDSKPVRSGPYRVPHIYHKPLEEEITKMRQNGILQNTDSQWSSPILAVPKRGTNKVRIVCDYRRVNKLTERLIWPLPRVDDVTNLLSGSKYFTKLDVLKSFWQIPIENKEDRERTAIQLNTGSYEFTRMPMGIKNAAIVFQRCMSHMLDGINWMNCLSYLDDIIIPARTFDEHITRLKEVLARFVEFNVTINLDKSQFCEETVSYLGYTYSNAGFEPDKSRIRDILQYPSPTSVTETQSAIGFLSYFRQFIPGFANICRPLYELIKQDRDFSWTDEAESALRLLIHYVTTAPTLIYPDYSRPFILRCDASNTAIGAVLLQADDEGRERPISYFSKTLNSAQKNYSTYDKEGLAVVSSLRNYRHIVLGYPVTVYTDHKPLATLTTCKHKSARLARWAIELEDYNLEIKHLSGKSRAAAPPDALSRISVNALVALHTTDDEFKRDQAEDAFVKVVRHYIETGDLPPDTPTEILRFLKKTKNLDRFLLRDDIVYLRQGDKELLCVPATKREEVLEQCHESIFSGHRGADKTLSIARKRFYWPEMVKDVRVWVHSCIPCGQRKRPDKHVKLPLKPLESSGPFDRVSFDICGPYHSNSSRGNKYVIAFCDHFSRFIEAKAIPNKTTEEVSQALLECVVLRYGLPKELLSDNAQEFVSKTMTELTERLGIKRILTSPHRPQTDGKSERYFSTMNNMLSMYTQRSQRCWDDVLQYCVFAYNVTDHDSLGISPFRLLHGFDPMLPVDVLYPVSQSRLNYVDSDNVVVDMLRNMSDAWLLARENMADAQAKYKLYHDKGVHDPKFSVGDHVYQHIPSILRSKDHKLKMAWDGPYVITEMRGDHNAIIQRIDDKGKTMGTGVPVHLARCKKAKAPPRMQYSPLDAALGGDEEVVEQQRPYNLRPRK